MRSTQPPCSSEASSRSTVLLYRRVRSDNWASVSPSSPSRNAASRLKALSTAATPPGAAFSSATDSVTDLRGIKRHPRRSEEHTSELQSRPHLVCRLLLEKKKNNLLLTIRVQH